jgi:hypothetical protein
VRDIQANVEVRVLIGDDAACGLGLDVTAYGGTPTNRGARWVLNRRGEDERA